MNPVNLNIVMACVAAAAMGACIYKMFFHVNKGEDTVPAWVGALLALNWLLTELQRYELLTK